MKNIPNLITILRIVFSVILLLAIPLTSLFYMIYILCGLSDVVDGYIARKTNTTSKLGATLDSIADAIFIAIVLGIFIPMIELPDEILIWILTIACIRMISLLIGYYRYHTIAFIHTYGNKLTGLVLFCFPMLLNVVGVTTMAYFICCFASLSAVEELVINITSKELVRDAKSLFCK